MINTDEMPDFEQPRETVDITIPGSRERLAKVFVPGPADTWLEGQKLQEEGGRVTVLYKDSGKVKNVSMQTFEQWQKAATQR